MLVLMLVGIPMFGQQSPVFSGLQSQVNALTTSSPFETVVSVDTKVTEAAAANLITPDEFETLDAHIRTIYRTSGFSKFMDMELCLMTPLTVKEKEIASSSGIIPITARELSR